MAVWSGAKASLAIANAFDTIGVTADGTAMPRSDGNMEPIAWEFFVASRLRSQANARYETAKKVAIVNGVIEDGGLPGSEEVVFDGQRVAITRVVKKPAERFDKTKAAAHLRKNGVTQAKVEAAWKDATTENKPAVEFKAAVK